MENSVIALRLKEVINKLGLTDSQFADNCEINRSTLSLFLSGKNKKINDVLLSQIHIKYPEVSIPWLLFGEGNMIESENPNKIEITNKDYKENLFQDDEILNEIQEFPYNSKGSDKYSNLTTNESSVIDIQLAELKRVTQKLSEIMEMQRKEERIELKRKVNKITIYYDDNTFQTFLPASENQNL